MLRWTGLADAITANLRRSPSVEAVDSHIPLEQLGSQAILFEPSDRLHADFQDVIRFGALAKLWERILPS